LNGEYCDSSIVLRLKEATIQVHLRGKIQIWTRRQNIAESATRFVMGLLKVDSVRIIQWKETYIKTVKYA